MTVRESAKEIGRHSNIVVGTLMGALLIYLAFAWAGWKWGLALSLVAIYEGWTLINAYPEDTLSESIWRLSARPLVPWMFGGLSVWMIESRFLQNPYLIAAWFFLQGHFFFQAYRENKELVQREAAGRVAVVDSTGDVTIAPAGEVTMTSKEPLNG